MHPAMASVAIITVTIFIFLNRTNTKTILHLPVVATLGHTCGEQSINQTNDTIIPEPAPQINGKWREVVMARIWHMPD
jgi:hypothetical protein